MAARSDHESTMRGGNTRNERKTQATSGDLYTTRYTNMTQLNNEQRLLPVDLV